MAAPSKAVVAKRAYLRALEDVLRDVDRHLDAIAFVMDAGAVQNTYNLNGAKAALRRVRNDIVVPLRRARELRR